jgi:hypothetical protein
MWLDSRPNSAFPKAKDTETNKTDRTPATVPNSTCQTKAKRPAAVTRWELPKGSKN